MGTVPTVRPPTSSHGPTPRAPLSSQWVRPAAGRGQSPSAGPSSARCVGSRPGPGCSQVETHRPPGHRQIETPSLGGDGGDTGDGEVEEAWGPGARLSPPRRPRPRVEQVAEGPAGEPGELGAGTGTWPPGGHGGPEGERPGRAVALSLRGAKPDPWGLAVSRGWAESSPRRGGLAGAAGAGKRARLSGRASEVPPGSGHRGTEDAEPGVAQARQPGTSWPRGESSGCRAKRQRPPRWEDPRSPMAPREARGRSGDADR